MTEPTSASPTLYERLADHKQRLESEASRAGPGPLQNTLREKLRELDVAAHMNEWLSSPGLRAPR
jgi:hypothetical protein